MKTFRIATLSVLATAVLAACSSMPASNASLDQARSDYRGAQADPKTRTMAPAELKQAGDALTRAETSFSRRDEPADVDHLAYLARQRTALAQAAASRKGFEADIAAASTERDQLRLAARTREADAANSSAASANLDASRAQRQATASQQQAATSQQQASEAERRSAALEAQLRELNAKKTDRGMVITIGDVLFDTGRAQLKSGGIRNVERLGAFLKEHPQHKARIEGYTDSTGSDAGNQALSERRADSVLAALVDMGVTRGQLAAQGYGDAHPVAGNDNSGGRQMNRRVEIVLSDENGVLGAR